MKGCVRITVSEVVLKEGVAELVHGTVLAHYADLVCVSEKSY